jgi:hypothetical protein
LAQRNKAGSLGYGWSHSYDFYLEKLDSGDIVFHRPDGTGGYFNNSGDDSYSAAYSNFGDLVRGVGGTYHLKEKGGTIYGFRTDLKLDYIENSDGNRISAFYSPEGRLSEIRHSGGQIYK